MLIKLIKNTYNDLIFFRYIPSAESMFNVSDIYDSSSIVITMQSSWYSAVINYLPIFTPEMFSFYVTLFEQRLGQEATVVYMYD